MKASPPLDAPVLALAEFELEPEPELELEVELEPGLELELEHPAAPSRPAATTAPSQPALRRLRVFMIAL